LMIAKTTTTYPMTLALYEVVGYPRAQRPHDDYCKGTPGPDHTCVIRDLGLGVKAVRARPLWVLEARNVAYGGADQDDRGGD